jgi:hypothetical protein
MKITLTKLKSEFKKTVAYFKARDEYRIELRGWIKKYGIVNLPESVQRTIPTDGKVLYEIKWYFNLIVWLRIFQITWLNVGNEGIRSVLDGQ